MLDVRIGCMAVVATLASAAVILPARAIPFPGGIAAGDVTESSAVLWAQSDSPTTMTFEISSSPGFSTILGSVARVVSDPSLPAKAQFTGLNAGASYHYRATDGGGNVLTGTFRTPAPAGASTAVRFGVTGDLRQELSPYPAIRNAASRNLDFFVMLGDTIYADYPSPNVPVAQATTLGQFRDKHAEALATRNGLGSLADLRRSTATFATIDDHEVTNDFAGGAAPSSDPRFQPSNAPFINRTTLFQSGVQAFTEYMPIEAKTYTAPSDPRSDGATKLYRAQTYGQTAAAFVLDARSFRDAALPPVTNLGDPAQIGAFLVASATQPRTFLGAIQFAELKADLLAAQLQGVLWKFIMLPEPIQNLGVLAAGDRYEGYAAERNALLKFIDDNGIANVVFVAADIHGTLVNDLSYRLSPFGPDIKTSAFEITTGSVAFDQPFGQTVAGLAASLGLITPAQLAFYESLPLAGKDAFIKNLIDGQLAPLGYDPLGLDPAIHDVQLLAGDYVAAHTYGWSEFDIDSRGRLLITTYGIDPYSADDLATNAGEVVARTPRIVSRFAVDPAAVPAPASVTLLAGALGMLALRKRQPRSAAAIDW